MSMELMVLAMKAKVGNQSRKLVLLKLADNACDMGECWPSYQHVADQCEMAKRTAMRHIDALVKEGFVRKEQRKGGVKGNRSNLYIINRKKLVDSTIPPSDKLTPPLVTDDHLGSDRVTLPPSDRVTPRISHSLEPVNEPNKNTKKNSLNFSCWPSMPSEQTLRDWFAMRKRMKANVNQTVVNRFAKELSLAVQHGVSVDDCLAECVVRNWRGFAFAWMDKPVGVVQKGSVCPDDKRFDVSGEIYAFSPKKDVSKALLAGYKFFKLPDNHKTSLLEAWRKGLLPVNIMTILEKQGVLL